MINEVVINGIKYIAVDEESKEENFSCEDCDIYKAKVPQNMMQLPLCYEHKVMNLVVNRSVEALEEFGKRRRVRYDTRRERYFNQRSKCKVALWGNVKNR